MRALTVIVSLASLAAFAEGEETASQKTVEVTGYGDTRTSYARSRIGGLLPTNDQPQLQELLELNAQVKVSFRPRTFVSSDLSLVANFAGNYRGTSMSGAETIVADHRTAASLPVMSINELYFLHEFAPWINVLIGKKRVVWGPSFAVNPTDFLNARRDPTDPTLQRTGIWMAQVEVPLERFTFSLFFSPTVTEQVAGIPTHFVAYPSWDLKDSQLHYQLAGRIYALVAETDLNLMFFYGNKSTDEFQKKFRLGASASRVFFDDLETHVEVLFQSGSPRDFVDPSCVANPLDAVACVLANKPVMSKSRLNDKAILPRLLVGARKQFADDSMLSIEYLYQADGWSKEQFQAFVDAAGLYNAALAMGLPASALPTLPLTTAATTPDGLPTRLSFDPRAQHYAFLSYQKPRIKEDFTAQLAVIASLLDLSTLWTPSVSWAPTDWLTLSLFGFIPVPGLDSLSPKRRDGSAASEYGTIPFTYRVMFEARAYY